MARRGRRFHGLLVGAGLSLLAAPAAAQQAPRPPPAAAPRHRPCPPPSTPAAAATPAPAAPVEDPPYDPSAHGGLSEGAFLRATRGTGRRSTGMMITGISFMTLGAALMAGGSAVYLGANQCSNNSGIVNPDGTPQGCAVTSGQATGMALLVAGLVGIGHRPAAHHLRGRRRASVGGGTGHVSIVPARHRRLRLARRLVRASLLTL